MIRNKIELLSEEVRRNIDIFMALQTKTDDTFRMSQFIISGFAKPFRFDQTDKGGSILVYIKKDIPSKLLKATYIYDHTECSAIEVDLC